MLKNQSLWLDSAGQPIQAHGGCILDYNGTWYWYGEHKGADNLPGTTRVDVIGVSCYSSRNLLDWHYEGLALPAEEKIPDHPLSPSGVCERPKVLFNQRTRKFVMWMHIDSADYTYAGAGVAISDTPAGPFRFLHAGQPNRQDCRDMTLFLDYDQTAYLIHSTNWNKTLNIARLTPDYTDVDGFYTSVLQDQEREAPAIFRKDDMYYMITSGCTGWNANSALYACCPHLLGQWKLIDNPCEGPNYRKTFYGQSTYVFQADNKHYLLLDHWQPKNLQNSGYSILPVTIQNGVLKAEWTDYFNPVSAINNNPVHHCINS